MTYSRSFFDELKRRKVVRMAVLYVAAEFAALQAAERPDDSLPHQLTGEIRSVRGNLDGAVEAFQQAIGRGLRNYYFLRNNRESKHINEYPPFERMMADLELEVDRMREQVLREEA